MKWQQKVPGIDLTKQKSDVYGGQDQGNDAFSIKKEKNKQEWSQCLRAPEYNKKKSTNYY